MCRERPTVAGLMAGMIAALLVSTAQADVVEIFSLTEASTEGVGGFTGSLEYDFDAFSNVGTLTVSLTNTSDVQIGLFITGFVFNIGSGDPNRSSLLLSGDYPMFENVNNESAAPFGSSFDGGAALGGDWLGGGNPNFGIASGDTGTFMFEITASDAAGLSAMSFLDGHFEHNFIVRFRGGAFSDKVPAVIPAPAALSIFALAGFASRRRRRND